MRKIRNLSYIGYFLFLLRLISIFSLLFLLFNPSLNIITNLKYKPKVSFFIDNSKSMGLSIDKKELINRINYFTNYLDDYLKFDYFLFGDTVREVNSYKKINFKDELTNIDDPLDYLNRLDSDEFIFITDGIQNSGNYNLTLPNNRLINCVGIGKKNIFFDDISIENIEIVNIGDDSIKFNIKINNQLNNNYNDVNIKILNDLGDRIIEKIDFKQGDYIYNKKVSVSSEYLSTNNFFIIASVPNENDINNNIYRLNINQNLLLNDDVLIVSGSLSNNSKKIKQMFLNNKNTSIDHYYKIGQSLWSEDLNLINYNNYNTIIFDQFPIEESDLIIYNNIMKNEGLNFIFFVGPNIYEYNHIYYKLLENFDYELNILEDENSNSFSNEIFNNDLRAVNDLIKVFPVHNTLLEVVKNNNIKPTLSYSNDNIMLDYFSNKMFVFIPDLIELSNLSMNLENSDVLVDILNYYYNIFINGDKLDLFSNKHVYDLREETLIYYNNKLDMKINDIYLNIFDHNNKLLNKNHYDNIVGDDLYVFNLNIVKEGDYFAKLNVELSNGIVMESNGLNIKFIISSSEYKDSNLNDILLKNIAHDSNGKYYTIDSLDDFIKYYDKESYFKVNKFRLNVFYFHRFWLLVIFTLIIEWIIRRNKGLL